MDHIRLYVFVLMLRYMDRIDASSPEMTFTGTMSETNGSALLHFVCQTSSDFFGCTVNFLKNGRSQESIRYDLDNKTCYHSNEFDQGLCKPEICRCSSCKKFIWNYTLNFTSNRDNLTFECDGNIFANAQKYKGSTKLQLTQNKFIKLKSNISEYGRKSFMESPLVTKSTTTVQIQGKDKTCDACADHEDDDSVHTLVMVITLLVVFICIILLVHTAIKIRSWFKQKTPINLQRDQAKPVEVDVGSESDRPINEDDPGNQDEHAVAEIAYRRPNRKPPTNDASSDNSVRQSSDTLNNPLLEKTTTDNDQPNSSCSETEDGASNIKLISNQQ